MSRKSWKKAELELARRLGGERVPVSGRTRGWAPDIAHPRYALEVKTRVALANYLEDGMDQAVKSADWVKRREGVDKLPVLVIHKDGQHFDNAYVVVRLRDAREWWGIGDGKEEDL